MNINDAKSDLKMKNLFFSKCSCERKSVIEDGEYNIELEKNIEKIEEHIYDVSITTTISKTDLQLVVVANAQFIFDSENDSIEESIIGINTVAIMFPFIRSQVTLMTSQPGMSPIVLPPINTTKLK